MNYEYSAQFKQNQNIQDFLIKVKSTRRRLELFLFIYLSIYFVQK